MRLGIAVLVAAILLATTAIAEPDALQKLHKWLWPNARPPVARTEPAPVFPVPEPPPIISIEPVPAPESPVALPRPRPAIVERQPKPKVKAKPPVVLDDSPVECWKVQWGASMSCNVIRANEHIYEGYSLRRKCASRACLTPEQIKGIESCFPVKKRKLQCP